MAFEVAGLGLHLALIARRQHELQRLASDIRARNKIETRVIVADLGNSNGVAAVQTGTDDLDVGLLVAAAGFGTSGPFLDSDLANELEMLDVNCRSVLALSLHFGRRLAKRGRGGLVLLSSLVARQGVPKAAHYAATKAYIQSLAEALHVELGSLGIDVLASAPGPVNSGFADRAGMKMGMTVAPADVARTTLNALGKKTTVVPGLLSKFLTYSLLPLPRVVRVRIMGQVMKGMTR